MRETTTLIFDFDGTIADTFSFYLATLNTLAQRFHFRKIAAGEVDDFRNMSSREVVDALKVPLIKLPLIVWEARKLLKTGIAHIAPISGIKPALLGLQQLDAALGILTSNSVRNVNKFLRNNDLEVFDFVFSSMRIWEKSRTLKKFIAHRKLERQRVYYIGDETRDIEAAQQAGVKAVAVTWGYNSEKILRQYQPDFILSDPAMLVGLLSSGKTV